jgi:hypothetical protein
MGQNLVLDIERNGFGVGGRQNIKFEISNPPLSGLNLRGFHFTILSVDESSSGNSLSE